MKLSIFIYILILVTGTYDVNSTLIESPTSASLLERGCEGVVVLSSFYHPYELVVNSTKLRARELNGRIIKAKSPETKERIFFQIVKFEGDCCWHIRNQYRGGQKFTSTRVGVHIPGWNIKAVKLCKHDQK